jgi:hypothetical protein
VAGLVKTAFAKRLQGDRRSPVKAALVATVTGAAAAALTYRLMRS